jgi:WD40 repeat protein
MRFRRRLFLLIFLFAGIIYSWSAYADERPGIFVFRKSSSHVNAVAFSPDHGYILAGIEATGTGILVKVWDLATGRISRTFGKKTISGFLKTLFSPDGRYMLLMDWHPTLWDVAQGKVLRTLDKPPGSIDAAAFSPDARFLLLAGRDSGAYSLWLWDVGMGRLIKTFEGEGHSAKINSVSFSPDGRHVISGSSDYTLKLWDVASGREIRTFEGHLGAVDAVAFSPDGRYVLSASDTVAWLWDVASGEDIRAFKAERGHTPIFDSAVFSPDGRYVLSYGFFKEITLWEVSTGREMTTVKADEVIHSIAFSPDGRYAISGHSGETIAIWDVEAMKSFNSLKMGLREKSSWTQEDWKLYRRMEAAQLDATMISFDDGEWVVMTPEGYFNTSPEGAKHLKVRVGRKAYSIKHFYERFYDPALIVRKLSGEKALLAHDIRKGVAPPPRVRIIKPKSGASYDEEAVAIVVEARDTGGGIDEIRLYHNKSAVGGKKGAVKVQPIGNNIEKTYEVTLLPGDNIFRAVGFSRDRTESNPHQIVVKHLGRKREIALYLVVVGINNYKNPALRLNFAVADAAGLKEFFEQTWKTLFSGFYLREIYDAQATKKTIQTTLSELGTREQDVVLIYLAGHGLNIGDEWYFISYDVLYPEREDHVKERAISSTEMAKMIVDIRALKKTLFIDACKSGGLLYAISRGVEDRRAIAQLARSTGTHVIAASTDKQFASEISQLGHGVFTYALLQGLGGEAGDRDHVVTVRELIAYIEGTLPDISEKYSTRPQYPIIDSRGQDFPLVVHR